MTKCNALYNAAGCNDVVVSRLANAVLNHEARAYILVCPIYAAYYAKRLPPHANNHDVSLARQAACIELIALLDTVLVSIKSEQVATDLRRVVAGQQA